VGKPGTAGKTQAIREDNIKTDLQEVGVEGLGFD